VVVLEGAWIATHTGPLLTPGGEVPPTGRTINLPFAATMRVDGEHVASMHVYFDQLAFLDQLGLVPKPKLPERSQPPMSDHKELIRRILTTLSTTGRSS
jgi:hypothetical protein